MRTVRAWVAGRVQGVSYRASLAREASALGLSGWVQNLPDGRVAFVAQGEATAVEALLTWAKHGPRLARVEHLQHEAADAQPITHFEIRQ